jgi:segregation and condensation protein B
MTDENREARNEEEQITLDPMDVRAEDTEESEPAVQDQSEREAEAAAEGIEAGEEPPEFAQEEEAAGGNGETAAVERADATAEESQGAEETVGNAPEEEPSAQEVAELPVVLPETTQEEAEPETQDQGTEGTGQVAEASAPDNPPSEIPNPQSETPTVESVIEAILFATDEPLTDGKLASIVETTAKQVRESVESLNAKYAGNHSAFRIEQIAGGYQMLTLNLYNPWLKKMLRARSDSKLSPAAMETLAIIAYKQPIIRADIEAIRGVAVGEVIRSLMYKGLVKIAGRAEILGRPMLYGTTKKFLEIFGLNSLKDLPKAEELKNPDRQ